MEEPVKELAARAIAGAAAFVAEAREAVRALPAASGDAAVSTSTERGMPLARLYLGVEAGADAPGLSAVLDEAERLLPSPPAESTWRPYLGDALDAGIAGALALEVLLACRQHPEPFSDADVAGLGERLAGRLDAPLVLVLGDPPSQAAAGCLYADLVERGALALACGRFETMAADAGAAAERGWAVDPAHLRSLGPDIASAADALGLVARIAMHSGVSPGRVARARTWVDEHLFGFVMVLGEVTGPEACVVAAGVTLGMHSVGETYIPQLLPIHSLP